MQIAKIKKTSLLSPFNASDTTLSVVQLVDHKNRTVDIDDFDGSFVLTIRQGNIIEMVLCDAITQNADGSATVDIVASVGRDLSGVFPYEGGDTGENFGSGAEVVNGNDPYTMYQISVAYADALAIAGVPNAGTAVKGIVEKATDDEVVAGTAIGSNGAPLFIGVDSPYIARLVKKRVTAEVSSATPTIDTDIADIHQITALATNITSMSTNLSGTPYLWDILVVDIVSAGDYTIAWGANFVSGDVYNLPTSMVTGQKLKCVFNFDGVTWALTGFA